MYRETLIRGRKYLVNYGEGECKISFKARYIGLTYLGTLIFDNNVRIANPDNSNNLKIVEAPW